jgi:hypothetical protein
MPAAPPEVSRGRYVSEPNYVAVAEAAAHGIDTSAHRRKAR